MSNRYQRNRIYISDEEQEIIKHYPIIIGGSGIGSIIAECALRLGFETITIVDGDEVELSNLNRQNYTENDISLGKVDAIKSRLKAINTNANIKIHNCFISEANMQEIVIGHRTAINALDFTSNIPLIFDKFCQEQNIHVIHPYNLGWAGLVAVISPNGNSLSAIAKPNKEFNEVDMVEYASSYLKFWGKPLDWIDEIVEKYKDEKKGLPPPQLSIASWKVAAMCTHILFNIALDKPIKKFPEFYISTILDS